MEEAALAAPAHHEHFGVLAFLDEDLGGRPELDRAVKVLPDAICRRPAPVPGPRGVRPTPPAHRGWAFLSSGRWEAKARKSDVPRQVMTSNGMFKAVDMRPARRSAVVENSGPSTPTHALRSRPCTLACPAAGLPTAKARGAGHRARLALGWNGDCRGRTARRIPRRTLAGPLTSSRACHPRSS